ncbi:uncharacterized protein LOC115678616 [Syzygium oleosum]|uniref:uncharacterized protein LOC115678616 n=1 Tax=Syzygium oleosum TaxID=219896 RepID=UPI0011D26375|nr:uncharacterized protein LOC115678616 [Syzygium oleosum]XP_030457861.1 uncharacterized protein LOC115678616 [Syzygium oleosum]XP_056171151.1 uncharacterized protein LOC115678616 [Syzygium oleosum]
MSGLASSSHPAVGMSGSSGLSHVYIQHPPLRCSIPGSRGLFYDDGNKIILSPANDQVYSWKVVPFDPAVAPISDSISDGPILAIRFSLDGKLIAIQRSNHEIQFQHRETGETFSQTCKSESENILGFFWTDCPLCDLVFVKTSGLDLFAYNSESKILHLVETRKLNVSWYVYTHESRLVLLASGMQCKTFTGFQLSSVGIIRLPKFEMSMAKTEANNKPVLAAEDVYIVTVYGRIYCLQVDRVAMLLHSYRFYRDAVVQQGSLPIYSSKVAISVVDNVLLVHQVDAKVIILYDIFLDSRAPISAPLPLLLRGFPRSSSLGARSSFKDVESSEAASYPSDHEATMYGDDWTFLVPDLICDVSSKLLWKIYLDLEAIAASSSEVSSVLDFLQRRKLEAYKAKHLCLAMARTAILERRPVTMVAKAIDVLVTAYSNSFKTGYFKGTKAEKAQASGAAYATIHGTGANASRSDTTGKSVEREYVVGLDAESFERSTFSETDSDENGNTGYAKPNSNGSGSKLLLGVETRRTGGQTSLHSENVGASNNILRSTLQPEPQVTSPAVSPDEMYTYVFTPVEEEMAGDPSYLVAVIVEFLRSCNLERIKVRPNIYALTAQLLARNERYAELGLFILNQILEPSKEVALQLLESGRHNRQIRKLGLDMLRQLSLHDDYVVFLVQDGYYLEALRYMKKHKVTTIRPSMFLEAAFASSDSQHLAAVLRFFSDYIPGFRSSPDHNTYYHLLNEMSMAAV